MTNIKRLLTNKEAAEYLGVSYKSFQTIVNRGEIGYLIVGKSKRYTTQELDRWLNNTTYHSEYTSEKIDRATMPTYRLSTKQEPKYSLEALLVARQNQKRHNSVCRK